MFILKFIDMKKIIVLIFMISTVNLSAQDMIYLRDGSKIKAKITQVNESNIIYKIFENLTGPDFVISRSKISVIVYENGTHDLFSEEEEKREKKTDPFATDSTIGKNIIGINYFDMVFSNFTFHYERLILNNQLGIKGGFSFAVGEYSGYMGMDKEELHGYLAFNYYPLKQKRVSYLCGPMILAGQAWAYTYEYPYPGTYNLTNYIGFYINNGLVINITKNFTFSTILGLGLADRGDTPYGQSGYYGHVNLEFNTCIRF